MSDIRKLYWESSHYLAGRLVLLLLGFFSFPFFTRIFSVSDYGIMSLMLSTVGVLTALSKLGMQNAVQRFYPDYAHSKEPLAFQRYYSTLFFGAAVVGAACTGLYIGIVWGLGERVISPALKVVLVLSSVLIVIRAVRSMQTNLMQVERRTVFLNVTEILNRAGVLAVIIAMLFFWERGIKIFILATVLCEAVVVVTYIPVLVKRNLLSLRSFDTNFFRTVISFSVPLMSAELAWLVLDTGDRYLIGYFIGAQAVGYYAAAYNVANQVQELVNVPLSLALFPICLKIWSTKGESEAGAFLSRSLDHFVMAAVCIVCTFTVVSRDLIVLLASKKYESAHTLLPWLVSGLVLSAVQVFFKPGLLIHKKVFKVLRATCGAAIINVVLNVLMLPRLGVKGAAIATLLSYAAWILLMAQASLQELRFGLDYMAFLRYLVAGAVSLAVVWPLRLNKPVWNVVTQGILVPLVYLGFLWMIDGHFRTLLRSVLQSTPALRKGKPTVVVGA
jgi:O-antigen/teichoic acid export membrane protein